MKTTLAILLFAVGAFAWSFWPQPPQVAAPLPPKAKAARLAPDGTYYTTEYVSTMTKSGVVGFPPGQELQFVESHGNGKWLMTDGRYTVEVRQSTLTNDLDVAAAASANDGYQQRNLLVQRSHDEHFARQEVLATLTASEAQVQANRVGDHPSLLDKGSSHVRGGRAVSGSATYVDQHGYAVPVHTF